MTSNNKLDMSLAQGNDNSRDPEVDKSIESGGEKGDSDINTDMEGDNTDTDSDNTDQETDNTVQCWTKKNTFETFCPFREENKIIADEKAAVEAAAVAKNNSGVNGTGWGDESGGSAGLVLALMFFCCCLPALGAVLYIKREQVKIFLLIKKIFCI